MVDAWRWEAVEDACIGREWRESLEKLAKSCKLKWLLEDGVAVQMVNLLPFFQNIVLKCGEQGNQSILSFFGGTLAQLNS